MAPSKHRMPNTSEMLIVNHLMCADKREFSHSSLASATDCAMQVPQLNDSQSAAFQQLKEAVGDCQLRDDRDEYLLKWLVARNFDVDQAEKMLRHSLEWRKVNQMDDILDTWKPAPVIEKYFPMGFVGCDKTGCPVWVNPFGSCDFKGLLQSVSKRDYMRHVFYLTECCMREMDKQSRRLGRAVTQETVIFDMEHASLKQLANKPVMEIGTETTKLTEAHYPEYLHKVFVINAPQIFPMIFAVIKPFMQPATVNKIRIFGTNREEWKAALLEDIDADQLPVHYGGTMTDPDGNPMCPSKICYGGEVPKSFYVTKSGGERPDVSDAMECVTVSHGSKLKLEFHVKIPDSILKWEFVSEGGDIGFHVYYKRDGVSGKGDEKVDVFPWDRVDSHVIAERYQVLCTRPTTYTVEFDNSFSYFRSKKIWYSIVLEEPFPVAHP